MQQAAFDDIVFKVDVMRNVASRHKQNDDDQQQQEQENSTQLQKWSSLPIINLNDNEERKNNDDDGQNGDEGLQEVRNSLIYVSLYTFDCVLVFYDNIYLFCVYFFTLSTIAFYLEYNT